MNDYQTYQVVEFQIIETKVDGPLVFLQYMYFQIIKVMIK